MRVLIVDDEPAARARLRRLLAAQPDISAVLEAADAPSALALLAGEAAVDLAVLDIEMPGGSGLQLAAQLPSGTRLVFSTAYAEHALQAFELGALDYLHKPFHAERLAQTLARVREHLGRPAPQPGLQAPAGWIWLSAAQGERRRVQTAALEWLASADNYVSLHLPPLSFLERGSLAGWLARPELAGLLVRVHRCHAVNPAHVRALTPWQAARPS